MKKNLLRLCLLIWCSIAGVLATAQPVSHSNVPGVVIDYSPASSGQYIGSPSICILPNGNYVASHDFFGPKSSELIRAVTLIFRSEDRGKTWQRISQINGQFWSTLFVHNNELYIIGPFHANGNLVIRKSKDNGVTWTDPNNEREGLLLQGSYHTAPTPVIIQNGRVWRAMEHVTGASTLWAKTFNAFILSAPVNSDLLHASSWTTSEEKPFDSTYLNGAFGGWLEGNAVVDKKGNMLDILRVATQIEGKEFAAIIHISKNGREGSFDPGKDFIDFPGGSKKFTIRYDSTSGRYWTLSNYIALDNRNIKNTGAVRNTLALCSSADLIHWRVNKIILQDPDEKKHGFQYIDWQFDGKDIILVSRTAYDDNESGANGYHDANFLTFHRIKKFRKLANKNIE